MPNASDYLAVIDVLTQQDEVDYRKIALDLAKQYPELFLKLARRNGTVAMPSHYANHENKEAREYAREMTGFMVRAEADRDIVGAVRSFRNWTGCGLKEAVDTVKLYDRWLFREGYTGAARYKAEDVTGLTVPYAYKQAFDFLAQYTQDWY